MQRVLNRTILLLFMLGLLLPVFAQEQPTPPAPESAQAAPVEPISPPVVEEPIPAPPPSPAPSTLPAVPVPPITPEFTPPTPEEPVPPGRIRIRSTRQIFSPEQGIYQFFGEVTLETVEVTIHANEATYDANTDIAIARGNVSVRLPDGNIIWGNALAYNARTERWEFIDWSAEFPPAFLGQQFIAPVFIGGENVTGLATGGAISARNTTVTTCDLARPHYDVVARSVEIFRGDKLIARDCDFHVLGHRVLHIPWFFLSLKQNRSPIVPEAGQNDFEGYYLRLLYQYVFNPNQLGGVRLDLTQKRSIGVGVDHFYTVPAGTGEAFLYGRQGLSEYVARIDHNQQLPAAISMNFRSDIRRNSTFTLQPTTITDITTSLQRPTPHTATEFTFARQLDASSSYDRVSSSMRYNSNTAGGTFNYNATYQDTSSGLPGAQEFRQLDNTLSWLRRLSFADLRLNYNQRFDLDEQQQQFTGLQKLPEVLLVSKQGPIQQGFLPQLRSQYTLGWGLYSERADKAALNRYLFNWNTRPGIITLGKTTFSPDTSFTQIVYGDPDKTAKYAARVGLTARTTISASSRPASIQLADRSLPVLPAASLNPDEDENELPPPIITAPSPAPVTPTGEPQWLIQNVATYSRQDSRGPSTLASDGTSYSSESANESVQLITPTVRASLTTGRDLRNDRWSNLLFTSDAQVAQNVTTRQSLSYDLNFGRWYDLVSQFDWRNDPLARVSLGARYDMEAGRLKKVSSRIEWVITPVWRVQWIAIYGDIFQFGGGQQKELIADELLITRDLHCWDATLYVSRQQKYAYLYLRLKALNLPLPLFGIGRGGQVLNTDPGGL